MSLELEDPTPDIFDLFRYYDAKYFQNKLACVELSWSSRMTLCAGLCEFKRVKSGFSSCKVKLSKPLLEFRSRSDLVNTLLHEMIHAFLFVTAKYADRDGHGPEFTNLMDKINKLEDTSISVYHSFHDEVDHYRKHVWLCDGPCRNIPPYYGLVKRAMNRAPGPSDTWFDSHLQSCNGTFKKISEPEVLKKDEKVKHDKKPKEKPREPTAMELWLKNKSKKKQDEDLFNIDLTQVVDSPVNSKVNNMRLTKHKDNDIIDIT